MGCSNGSDIIAISQLHQRRQQQKQQCQQQQCDERKQKKPEQVIKRGTSLRRLDVLKPNTQRRRPDYSHQIYHPILAFVFTFILSFMITLMWYEQQQHPHFPLLESFWRVWLSTSSSMMTCSMNSSIRQH